MKTRTLLFFLFLPFILMVCKNEKDNDTRQPTEPTRTNYSDEWVIVETDIAACTDDLVALDILYRAMDEGKFTLKAVMVNREGEEHARIADIMNTYYNHPDIPIGVVHDGVKDAEIFVDYWKLAYPETYTDVPAYPTSLSNLELAQLPDAVDLYRQILSTAEDNSVNIVSIGFATNLARLLQSQPDGYSELNGNELVEQKVKALYIQAGTFGVNPVPDYNFQKDPESAKTLITLWPTAVYFSPVESGQEYSYESTDIIADLQSSGREDSPIYHVYAHHHTDADTRMWDAMCALQLVEPELFTLKGPYESYLDSEMMLCSNFSPNGKHFVQSPPQTAEEHDKVMNYLRDWMRKP
ncbi:MAG: nucleoside hydrolase [Bacteroidaceae bacterium]|nr:nucleoside hydrolase [Bacteroidaceae bacterium]